MKRRILAALLCAMLLVSAFAIPANASVVKVMKVIVNGARLRSGPGDYPVIKSLKKGTRVLYTGKKVDAFYQVRTSGGKVGYVYKRFLASYGAAASDQVYVTTKAVKMRKKPSGKSKTVKKLKSGTLVLAYDVRGTWVYVKTMSGKGGYIKASALAKP